MFPAATIPVMQLSMDYSRPVSEHLALGQQLRACASEACSSWAVATWCTTCGPWPRGVADNQAHDWALEFDASCPATSAVATHRHWHH